MPQMMGCSHLDDPVSPGAPVVFKDWAGCSRLPENENAENVVEKIADDLRRSVSLACDGLGEQLIRAVEGHLQRLRELEGHTTAEWNRLPEAAGPPNSNEIKELLRPKSSPLPARRSATSAFAEVYRSTSTVSPGALLDDVPLIEKHHQQMRTRSWHVVGTSSGNTCQLVLADSHNGKHLDHPTSGNVTSHLVIPPQQEHRTFHSEHLRSKSSLEAMSPTRRPARKTSKERLSGDFCSTEEPTAIATSSFIGEEGGKVGKEHSKRPDHKKRKRIGASQRILSKKTDNRSRLQKLVESDCYEIVFATMIVLSALVMAAEAQYWGWKTGDKADLPDGYGHPAEDYWPNAEAVLGSSEIFFGLIFLIEVALKLAAYRMQFFTVAWNLFDTMVVAIWMIEQSGHLLGDKARIPPLVLRIARLARTLRLLRLARSVQFADSLHLMVVSIKSAVSVGMWSIVILSVIMLFMALVLNHALKVYIEDMSIDEERRLEMFKLFGTCWRAFLTMLEITDGNWIPVTRILQEYISPWLAVLMVCYRLVVAFTIIKVITGVFLTETMRVARSNDELMIIEKIRERQRYRSKMQALFEEADQSGEGMMSRDEFLELVSDQRVMAWFSAIGLDLRDPGFVWDHLFDFKLSTEVDMEKFISGVARFRGPAQRIDVATVTHSMDEDRKVMEEVASDFRHKSER